MSRIVRDKYPGVPHHLSDLNRWLLAAFEYQKTIVVPEAPDGEDIFDWLVRGPPPPFYTLPENYQDFMHWRGLKDEDYESLPLVDRASRFAICLFTSWGNRWLTDDDGFFYGPLEPRKLDAKWLSRRLEEFFSVKWLDSRDTVSRMPWHEAIKAVQPGDMVYLDPPYPEVMGYGNVWRIKDQLDVIDWAVEVSRQGVNVIISNVSDLERLYTRAGMKTKLVRFEKGSKTRRAREEVIAWSITPG
jgi:site-specific DNA-adenine methylase